MQHNKSIISWTLPSLIFAISFIGLSQIGLAAPKEELLEIEKNIQSSQQKKAALKAKSENLRQEVEALRRDLISLSQSVQQREESATRIEANIQVLTKEEEKAKKELEERHAQSVNTLIALQRLALNPPEAIIAMPQPPGDMVRSAILLRSIVPQVQAQANSLRAEVLEYERKRKLLEDQKIMLGKNNQSLSDDRRRLTALIKDKDRLSDKYIKDSKAEEIRIAALSKRAESLQGLLAQIEKDKKDQAEKLKKEQESKPQQTEPAPKEENEELEIVLGKPPSGRPISQSKGQLSKPASGPVVMEFGDHEKLGGKHKGISIKTRDNAQVVATYDGQIAFAGPFRGYKRLLIIDHGEGYHTLLTGMDRIDVNVGQWLLSGEPVGVMSQNASSDANLYFELRKNGAPINPLPWIRQRNAKARG